MEKQNASDLKIAASYWFFSFAVAVLLGMIPALIFGFTNGFTGNEMTGNGTTGLLIMYAVSLLGIWFGAIYAGKNIGKRYFIKNKEIIVIKAVVINLGFGFISLMVAIIATTAAVNKVNASLAEGMLYISTLLYLCAATKYIKANN